MLSKPTVAEVYQFLRCRDALIVHFSGVPKGAGRNRRDHLFPNDLAHVIAEKAMGGVSCSLVKPGDIFYDETDQANATGCIGVVLGLKSGASLVAADPHDCGSFENSNGCRVVSNETDITCADLERSLDDRTNLAYPVNALTHNM